jgi:hypothetical protein
MLNFEFVCRAVGLYAGRLNTTTTTATAATTATSTPTTTATTTHVWASSLYALLWFVCWAMSLYAGR